MTDINKQSQELVDEIETTFAQVMRGYLLFSTAIKNTTKYPFSRSGTLLNSYENKDTYTVETSENGMSIIVVSKVKYANAQIYGYKKIPARDYMTPAINDFNKNYLPKILNKLEQQIVVSVDKEISKI